MQEWLAGETVVPHILLAVGAGVALIFVVVLVLWMLSLATTRRLRDERDDAERDLAVLESSVAEQGARLRMVGELHELAVHSVSAIVAQADGARYKAESEPAAAGRAAVAIGDSARSTLIELRRVMSIVRQGETDAVRQPGIKTARELFRVMREAGLDIRFEESGERFTLGQGVEVAIFRILQEALSNSLRYGGEGTEVRVTFRWSGNGLTVLVDDDGIRATTRRGGDDPNRVARDGGYSVEDDASALTTTPAGPGITEMRERAELFGGVLNAYSVPGVGFSVSAAFPELRHARGVTASGSGA